MAAPTRIVMVGTDPATRGGIASVVRTLRAGGLFERWPVDYVASHRDGGAPAKALQAARGLAALAAIALRHPRAVLHVHAASRWSFWRKSVYMAAALLLRWPVVFHLHGGGFARFHREGCGPLGRALVRFFLDRAAAIVVVSERWARWIACATANRRIVCIPNPVALPPAAPVARDRSLVVFAGRCEPAKGVYELLDAVSALRPALPRLRVECAGDGDLGALAAHAARLGLGARVAMRGWIGPGERDALLARAGVFVLPSHAEGLPVSLLEAMAAGCPVIATPVGGVPDLVRHGENGWLVPPRDARALAHALAAILRDPALAARLGAAARATVAQRHTAERAVERLGRLYAALGVERHAPAGARVRRLQETA